MLNSSNITQLKPLIKEASNLLGRNYIDTESFELFAENDQNASQLLDILKSCVNDIAKDLFDKRLLLTQKAIHIEPSLQTETDLQENNIYVYNLLPYNIFRIHKVLSKGSELYRAQNLEELKQDEYILDLFNIKTKVKHDKLSLLVAENNFYASLIETELTYKSTPSSDNDYCTLPKDLVIYKFCVVYCEFRGLLDLMPAFAQKYQKTLLYYIESSFDNSKPIRIY